MKGKLTYRKLFFTSAVIVFIALLFATRVVYNKLNVKTTEDKAASTVVKTISITLYKNDGTPVKKDDVKITNPIIQTSDFALRGEQIVKQAANYLGRNYDSAQAAYQPNGTKLDCSGLVRVALRELGVTTDGFYERGNDADLPRSVMNWIQYQDNYYFHEVGTYGLVNGTVSFAAADQYVAARSTVYNKAETLKVKYNGRTDNINVLKVNNPINSQLRWYNYYDANGNLQDLPLGTIVCAYGGLPYKGTNYYVGPDHMWICIGNLGTADAGAAANKLVEMGIITEAQKKYVKSESSTSKYWLIESSPKTGRDGVYICNWDPDLNSSTGNKGVGTIWAYQIAGKPETGNFTMDVEKVDKNNPNTKLAGAKYNFQDRNFSPIRIYTDSNVDASQYDKRGGAVTTGADGTAKLPVGGTANAYTKTIDKAGNYVYNYSIQEVGAPSGYKVNDKNQHFGYKVCTQLINNQYQVISVDIYYGAWDQRKEGTTWLWVNTTTRPTIWYTTSGQFVGSDPGAADTVAKFALTGSGANVKLTTVYYNEKITGDYNLNIIKKPKGDTNDEDSNNKYKQAMAGAKFEVKQYLNCNSLDSLPATPSSYGRSSQNGENIVTTAASATRVWLKESDGNNYSNKVKITNPSITDIYTIDETGVPEGTYSEWTRGPVALIVYKKVSGSKYVVDKVKLQSGANGYTATIPASGSAWIRIDSNGNETTDKKDYAIAIEASAGRIDVNWKNPENIVGKYNINIKKIDADTKQAIPGVEFKLNNTTKTTNENGIAQYEDVSIDKDSVNEVDSYTIEETENTDKYYKLDETVSFEVKKALNVNEKKYYIQGIRFSGESEFKTTITKNVQDISGRNVPITIEIDNDTNTITVVAENNNIVNGKFYLNKTDEYGSTNLDDTSFKVDKYVVTNYESTDLGTPTTVLNGKLSTIANKLIDDVGSMISYPGAYVYDIHETTAQTGYINSFKRIENGQEKEIAFVRLVIRCDENDRIVTSQEVIRVNGCTDAEYFDASNMVNNASINQSTRAVTLNIKNPGTALGIDIKKYAYNNGKTLQGGIYKVELDGSEMDTSGLRSSGVQTLHIPNIAIGDHTLRVYELDAPTGYDNVFDQFSGVDGIKIDFTVKPDGSKVIKTVSKDGNNYNFTPESQTHVENMQDIKAISEYAGAFMLTADSNVINVYIKDPTHFDFEMFKKEYTGKDDIAQEDKFKGTANFTIKEVSPESTDKFSGVLPTDTQSKFFTEGNVKSDSTYVYEITETDVSDGSDGYYRNLVNKKIKVTVVVDDDGKVSQTKTKYEIYDENGSLITGNAKKDLDTFIKLEVASNHKINLYIANMPTVGYKVRICKVDKDGNPYKRVATFDSIMSTTTSTDTISRTGITTNVDTGLANVTEGTVVVERGATHTYTINETKAPAGCIKLDGTIKLNVTFNNSTTGNVIQNANVKYYNASGTESILDGLDVTYNQGGSSAPLVTIFVPNEGTDFDFELKKVDSMGNIVKGAEFTVGRGQLRQNPDIVIPEDEREDFTKMAAEISDELSHGGSFSGELTNGTYTDKVPFGEYLVYSYVVKEDKVPKGYGNELLGKQIMVYIFTKKGSNNKPYVDKVTFTIIDTKNHGTDVTEQYRDYVKTIINGDKTKVDLVVTNPNGYKIRLNKTDLAGNPIESAKMAAYRANGNNPDELIVKLNEIDSPTGTITTHDSNVTSDYVGINKNEEQIWKIYENSVNAPYYNVFGQDKYLEVKVKMNSNGIISVPSYTVKDIYGREYSSLKQYVNQVNVITEDNDTIVNVTFKNPSGYKLKITKYNGDGTTELSGAVVKLDGTEVISNGNSHYENDYMAGASSSKTFTITEQSTIGNHVNVLAGKEIKLTVVTDSEGNISRTYKIMSGSTEVSKADKVYSYVSVGDVKIGNDGIAYIDVKIINPLVGKFNVKLYKTDEDGNLIKNYNATFSVGRSNGKMNIRDFNVTTSNGIADVDSNVAINDVNDSYHYELEETQAPLGYEKLSSKIQLDTLFKDTGDKLTLDETKTTIQLGNNVIPMSTSDGQFIENNTLAWYMDNSGDTALIKIYIKNTKKKFDLALRKYISKVENPNKQESPSPSRAPKLDTFSLVKWKQTHTAAYFHTKEAYKVEVGDIVTYRINIYNEGNVKGYATQITDYLESGLEYVDTELNREYGWSATVNPDGTTTVTTRHLQTTLLNEFGLPDFLVGNKNTPKWTDYVEIQCKVTRPATDEISYITDRAEITDHRPVEVDSEGYIYTLDMEDIDSQPLNVKEYHEDEMFNYDSSKDYDNDTYYEGFQDDDDKETVYVEKHSYDFVLSKTDGEEEISGAQFKIEELNDNNEYIELYSGAINKNKTIHEPEARGDSSVEFFKTYTYKITETSAIENYQNLLEGKYIIVKTYMDDEEVLYKGEYGDTPYSYFSRYGYAIYDSESDTLITDTDEEGQELYGNIEIEINRSNPPKIQITIPNERLYFGNYKINLKKIDTSNAKMENIPFYINGHRAESDNQGFIHVSEYNPDADENGIVNIDKYNVDTQDIYTIEEESPLFVDDEHRDEDMNPIYVAIRNEIKLVLTKSLDTDNERYYVSNIHVEYNSIWDDENEVDIPISSSNISTTKTINLKLIDGTTVPATIEVAQNGTITIKAQNEYIKGDYKLRLYKVDEENNPVPGIEFGVTGQSANLVTDNDGYTRTITNNITKDNLDNIDEFTITEYQDRTGKVVRIKSPIKITISKKNIYTKYVIDKIKLTEVDTGRESIESSARTELPNCAIDDDSGRTIAVKAIADSDGLITLSFENPPVEDSINVKIKKINSKDGSALNGVTFSARVNNGSQYSVTTSNVNGEDGIAYIDTDRRITSPESFTYQIKETAIPSTPEGLILITNYEWILSLRTKYDENLGKYVIDGENTRVRVDSCQGDETDYQRRMRQQEIANRIRKSVSIDGATLTLTIEDEQTTNYGLAIKKADMDTNAEISAAKFTIKEDGRVIAENKTIAEFTNSIAQKSNVLVNTTHRYEIYETAPAPEYQNILEKTYIELVITVAADGTVTETHSIKAQPNGTSEDVQKVEAKIASYVEEHQDVTAFVEKNGNNFKVNIPNPKDTITVSADLTKFETGDQNKRVNNAEFSVRRTTFESATEGTVDAAVSRFDSDTSVDNLTGITTRSNATNWIDRNFTATFGKVYYYELTETNVPTNYVEEFHSAIVKMYLEKENDENVVRASIVKIKTSETSEWEDYDATNFADRLSAEVSGTTIHVKWANELQYKFRLWKKSYNSVIPEGGPSAIPDPASGADMKITSSNGDRVLVDGLMHQTQMYVEEDVHSNTTYTYVINEKNPPAGHHNIFTDMDIVVTVRVGANGILSAANSSIDVRASAGKTVDPEMLAEARNNVELIIDTDYNVADVYIANKQIHNTYDIKIMKVSDKMVEDPITHQMKYKGIQGIRFYVMGNQQETIGSGTTGLDGTLTVSGIEPNGFSNNYAIAEDRTSAEEAGITPLHGWILLNADLSEMSASMTEEEIEEYLNEKNPDGTPKRFSLRFLDQRDEANGATVHIEGRTVIITIKNRTTDMRFNLSKVDPSGTRIGGSVTADGEYINGTRFRIVNSKLNPDKVLVADDELSYGGYTDSAHTQPNEWYEYTVRETATKEGYINVTQGYDILVHLQADAQGVIVKPEEDTRSYVSLVPNGLEEPLYSIDEIFNNNWVSLFVIHETDIDLETGEEIIVNSDVTLQVVNPFEYKLQLNKKDKNGSTPLSVAKVTAENIVGADISLIYDHGNLDERAFVLSQIAHAGTSGAVHVNGEAFELNKEPSITSEEKYIELKNRYAEYDENQVWRITESDVDSPYKNILEDKYIIVDTYFNGDLKIASHTDPTLGRRVDFYVIDKDGVDITKDYIDYIEVSTEKIGGQWIAQVTIKDPMIFKLGLYKKADSNMNIPLEGAHLKVQLGDQEAEIKDGAYNIESLEQELAIGESVDAIFNEFATTKGHKNILEGKTLKYVLTNVNGQIVPSRPTITENDTPVSDDEYNYIMSHISLDKRVVDGVQNFVLYVENPTSFEFNLTKLDIDQNELDGAEIKVQSSHSGVHILNGSSNLSFIEEDVSEHEIIQYEIKEIHTKDGAYINKFSNPVFITVTSDDGQVRITEKKHQIVLPNGSRPIVEFDELEYFDCYIEPENKDDLDDGEMQTLTIKMENPPEIEVELLKTQAGTANRTPIRNTGFTINSVDSHTADTNAQGLIDYKEEIHETGDYTIRVYEDQVASNKYVNILENKYMQFDISVAANGTITLKNDGAMRFFNKDNDSYYDNDVEITGDEATKIAEYCSVSVAGNKVTVHIEDPVKFDLTVIKEATDGQTLEGAEFEITSVEGLNDTIRRRTDDQGKIAERITWVNPGVYEYHVTEIEPADSKFENVLDRNMIVAYVKVAGNGELTLVSDHNGTPFGNNVSVNQRYVVKKIDGTDASSDDEQRIRKFCTIKQNNLNNEPDEFEITVINPIQTKLDIIKRQYNTEGQEEVLTDTRFTVVKNGSETLLNNAVVNEEIEIEEHDLTDSADYYDVYENSTNTNGAYVNILSGKFVRIYTELNAEGNIKITDSEGSVANTFDIYQTQHYGNPTKIEREGNEELYDSVSVWVSQNSDGVNILNVKVINPITIDVGVIKKQYGEGAEPIPDVSITITSDNTGDHNITSTRSEEVFSEGNIKPGTYNFIIRENNNPNPRYVNVLKDRYAKANVTISKTGDITLNNIKYYTNQNVEITDPEIKSLLEQTVYASIDKSGRVQKITFIIENPVTLKFLVHKVDLADEGLEGATFNVIKYVGDSDEVAKGMTSVDTDNDGVITFEDGDYMKAGIYRYEITELKPAAEKYVNILDCYDDGSQYKVVMYLKLNLNGTTEYVRDAQGTPFTNAGRTPYTIVNRNDASAEIPTEVSEIVHKYLTIGKTPSRGNNPDIYEVEVKNTPQVDIDVIKVTKENGVEKSLTGTKFSAEADDGKDLFEDIPATQDKEYTFKNVSVGRHEFYLTESEGVVNGGYINVLEDRYVRVYTTVSADGVMKITDRFGNEDAGYFEIYDGQYNDRSGSVILDRTEYAKIYECVSVESVRQSNGVYKLNLKVNNPERNYMIKLNKKVFGAEDINMENVEFFIRGTVDNEIHQLTTDKDGNISFEEKRVPVGVYNYFVIESKTSGDEFVNILKDNYIAVALKVNQDGTIEIVDTNGQASGNEGRYYILNNSGTEVIDPSKTIVDDFVRVAADNSGDEPELNFFIKDPEKFNFKLVKKDVLTNEKLNNVTFTSNVFYQESGASSDPSEADKVTLVNAETFEDIDISTIKTANIDGVDGVIMVPNILVDKTGTYTFVFHEESTDGLFKYLYKSHAEDITLKVDITVETDNEGRPIGYKVGQPNLVTGAKYIDVESTLTTQTKAQTVRAEVLNTPIRGHYNLVLSKLDKYTSRKLDGAEFDIRAEKNGEAYELYEDVDDLRIENAIVPTHVTVQNGEIVIENIRITPPPYQAPEADGTLETFNIILTETKAPTGYMLLDDPIVLEVTTAIDGEYDDAEYVVKSVNLVSGDNHGLVTKTFDKNEINVVAKDEYFDLALRKSIVSVAYNDSEDSKITEDETADRVPVVYEDDEIYDLNPGVTTANYRHVKNHVRVYPGQEVIYCLRVYNEGEIDGYAEVITDHLPEGLEFLATDKFNTDRGWTYDLNDQSLRTVKTTFLSKNNNPNNDRFNAENNLIKAMDENVATGVEHNLDFKEIEIKCRVSDNLRPGVILTNIAEISEYKAEGRTQETVDRDSEGGNADVPDGKDLQNYKESELTDDREDYVPGQEDDDDFEKLIVVEFDLALRKYITAINEEEVLADKKEAKYTDKVIEDTEDILGEGTASGDAEGTNDGANTNNVNESEGENGNTEGVDAQTGSNPGNINTDEESDEEDIDDDNMIKYDREPRVNVSTLKSGDQDSIYKDPEEPTTALYKHTKDPVEVSVDDIVTYTLEIFNEGTVDGYASLIKDDIPEGVEFVPYEEGDGSVNDKYRWKMVDENDEEVTDPKDAKYIVSDYLSKDNETEENGNLIRAFNPTTGTRLDSKYVQVQFRVICKQDYPKLITNYAQISDDTDDSGKGVKDRDSTPNEWIDGEDDQDVEHIWVTYMDLALRKFITGVTDFKTGKTQVVDTRIPQVDSTALIDETGTTAKYEHTKEPVLVHTNDVVIYTLRIYNEGSKDGYATQIKDDLPEGLEFLPDHEINKYYEWSLVDKNDKPVTRLEDATFAVTNYRSKDNETEERQNLIKSFDYYDNENDKPAKRKTPDYKDVKIAFKVTEPQTSDRILINEAQISEQTDKKGVHREDRDSTPNEWLGEDDEDIEKVRVLYFDLALRKWVTKAIVTQNGEEKVFETGHHAEDDPEDVVKVDLKKSKLNKVVVKFEYQIRITNEGEIEGYAKEIKDRIPEGLRFDPADNPTWTQLEENIIVTDELKDTLLKPGESAEVTVVLTWINSGDNLGLKVNVAEISKDYNDYGTHDIDSTPDNNVWGEDDIDDAPVMLAVKTGSQVIGYIALAVFVGTIIVLGVRRIKKINEG